ncbi:hypothetical protein [Planococcus halotolerans]|uniref:hypothetical protein n=1 Tax=Planococcus halotolerans TaxID=2233542 RepID=UPI001401FED0|nr:hypothetical protein [Planococcus halotolerans]
MTVITNEATKMDGLTKTYLEMYVEHIDGYKQYKLEKTSGNLEALQVEGIEEAAN